MQSISVSSKDSSTSGSYHTSNISLFDTLANCFNDYLNSMFQDFGALFEKKLENQESKLKSTELVLDRLLKTIESTKYDSQTSLGSIENSKANSNQTSRVKTLSISSQNQSKQILQVNQALKKLQQGIQYLEISLTSLKSKKSIEDPESHLALQSKKTLDSHKDHEDTMSKIQKLNRKVNKLSNDTSIDPIFNLRENELKNQIILQKSRSLINLSSRKYYPVSCPKLLEFERPNQKSQNQIENHMEPLNYREYPKLNPSLTNMPENALDITFNQNAKISDENKMPLINKSKSVLNQLLRMVRDEGDANVVMFYLKKGFKTVGQMTGKLNKNESSKNQVKKQLSHNHSEYFMTKTNTLQANNSRNNYSKNDISACSIMNVPGSSDVQSGNGSSWVKENFSSATGPDQVGQMPKLNHQSSESSLNPNMSKNKRKFQRTSNEQKMLMVKGKFRSNY